MGSPIVGKGARNRENRRLATLATVGHPASMTKGVARKIRRNAKKRRQS